MMSSATTEEVGHERKDEQLRMRTHLSNAKETHRGAASEREGSLETPPGDHEEGTCGKRIKSVYGARDAAKSWEMECADFMRRTGFKQGVPSSCALHRAGRNTKAATHGDDFMLPRLGEDLHRFREQFKARCLDKFGGTLGLRSNDDDDKSRRTPNGMIERKRDAGHGEAEQECACGNHQAFGSEQH